MNRALLGVSVWLLCGIATGQENAPVQITPTRPVEVSKKAEEPKSIKVMRDTEIKLRMAQSLSSKHAVIGERVELAVAEDLAVDGWVVVPKGTRVLGTVKVGKKQEKWDNSHDLLVEIDYIAFSGKHIKLGGRRAGSGKINKGAVVASTAALGLSGLLLAMDARTAQIPEGTMVDAWVDEDIELPPLGAARAEGASQQIR